jgi:hypothetical protein
MSFHPNRYERARRGDLAHIDVQKLGRILDCGGWWVHGREEDVRGNNVGFDYVHAAVDDHTRLAYAEIHPAEKGATAAMFLTRAAAHFACHGVTQIDRIITDCAFAYRRSTAFGTAVTALGAGRSSSSPAAPGGTVKSTASTRSSGPSGPAGGRSSPMLIEQQPAHVGSSTQH